jgi:3-isopropylmalate/(R)-2-methylmalate dehydratase small subunit
MEPFITLTGLAAPLGMINIDTDQIIPKQFLTTIKRTGLGQGLFYDLRFTPDGQQRPEFILNQPAYQGTKILVTGENFGCGSSREHAPWALMDFGIRCIIAESFADIFYNNCLQNGVLPAIVTKDSAAHLLSYLTQHPSTKLTVDLNSQTITGSGETIPFTIDAGRKRNLLNGLDVIGETLTFDKEISAYEEKSKRDKPWLWPQAS